MNAIRRDLFWLAIAFFLFIGGATTNIPATVVKPQDGYVMPEDVSLIDSSRMENDWIGEIQLNWLSYTFWSFAILAVIYAVFISCKQAMNPE